jgi:glycosyltransferase 2 family protein
LKPAGLLNDLADGAGAASNPRRARWIAWASLLLAALLLYLALRGLDWSAFLLVLRRADYLLLPIVFAWSSLGYLLRASRWRVLLSAGKRLPVRDVFWANMAGYLGNAVLPARAGDVIRAVYLGRASAISTSFAFATGLVERLVDLVVLIILGSAALALAGFMFGPLRAGLQGLAAVGVIGLACLLLLPRFSRPLERLIRALPFLNAGWKERLAGMLSRFLLGLGAILDWRRASLFLLLTAAVWLVDGLGAVLLGRILHLPLTLDQAFVLLAALGLSSAIPSTPGYLGLYQFAARAVLVPFGFSPAAALAFILFAQALGLIVVATWGGLSLWRFSRANLQAGVAAGPTPPDEAPS